MTTARFVVGLSMFTLLAMALGGSRAAAQTATVAPPSACGPERAPLGGIRLPQDVLADGKQLSAGTYQVCLTNDRLTPAVGQSPTAECWVDFVRNGTFAGREVATVIPSEEIEHVAKGPGPKPNDSRVDVLKGGDYVRAWINRRGTHYIINMPLTH